MLSLAISRYFPNIKNCDVNRDLNLSLDLTSMINQAIDRAVGDENIETAAAAVTDVAETEEELKAASMDLHVEEEELPLVAEDSYTFPPRKLPGIIHIRGGGDGLHRRPVRGV